jgi:hypothetical protein
MFYFCMYHGVGRASSWGFTLAQLAFIWPHTAFILPHFVYRSWLGSFALGDVYHVLLVLVALFETYDTPFCLYFVSSVSEKRWIIVHMHKVGFFPRIRLRLDFVGSYALEVRKIVE